MWCFCVGKRVGKTPLLILRSVGIFVLRFRLFVVELSVVLRLHLTVCGLAKWGISSTNVQISTNVDRSTNAQFSTNAPILPNPCCAFVVFFQGFVSYSFGIIGYKSLNEFETAWCIIVA
jgi:hypothetical protein